MAVDNAFDNAVKGVRYLVHVASTMAIPSDDLEATLFIPTLHTTVSILKSASEESCVKKVVITS
ncbi:hypothetical protein A1O7_02025 [Cladophialophora yegresii CBS 114405]|uniref:3-beta hydroxysteroid dehydrogenase/isomerase domain-containing protein n=1 Tax=Cladophialophora yegresii CBS 114405 TaxID=1182544 RepID=W9W0I5_9EURO|nr:uncharacterized protein A1O7_02025 [Cladophialophora yegresii CBS 114405]EXJ61597.1 hypothetical protein A1O7_02025 [Cladophialophora yegresii CBS 114405]